MLLSKN